MNKKHNLKNSNLKQMSVRAQRGFTLMELLLVLVILGLLAALVGPTLYQRIKPAKETAARMQIENFGAA
ncbi:prepilin-type N-terminal cleavage/methylation domain-containing protein, partial [Leptospira sp. SA-E8]|uniref:prepilin-type N-terminal cleavage/methylation domain-containing protein n=1 Tax=Leptospira sp. SA-E8 TaxID=3422259 RepID=UPI003EBA0B13